MMRKLSSGLCISMDILTKEYSLKKPSDSSKKKSSRSTKSKKGYLKANLTLWLITYVKRERKDEKSSNKTVGAPEIRNNRTSRARHPVNDTPLQGV